MNAQEILDVVKAFDDGKEIEYRAVELTRWIHTDLPIWDFNNFDYRVKKAKPVFEERWQMMNDNSNYTEASYCYYKQSYIDANFSAPWYKGQLIMVEVKL